VRWFDVAIVGAGPAGCSAAIFLARRGYSIAMIDRSVFPREKFCGDFLNPANWEIFEKLGVQDALLSLGHEKIDTFRLSTPSATVSVPFPSQNGRRGFGLGLRRSLLDDLLLRLAEKEGVALKQGSKPRSLGRDSSGWIMTCGDDSAEEKVRAKLLIGADGRNSWVANQVGLTAPNERAGKFVAFQLHLSSADGVNGDVQIHVFPGGYGGLVGLGGGMATLCFAIDKIMAREAARMEDLLKKYLCQNPRLKAVLDAGEAVGNERSVYPVHFRPGAVSATASCSRETRPA
jgi:menaquinone-9 beta-reductase